MENKDGHQVVGVLEVIADAVLKSCPLQPVPEMLRRLDDMRRSVIETVVIKRRAGVTAQHAIEVCLGLHGGATVRCAMTCAANCSDEQLIKHVVQLIVFKRCTDQPALDALINDDDSGSVPDSVWAAVSIALCKAVALVERRALYEVVRNQLDHSTADGIPLPVLSLFPQEGVYFVPNRRTCRSVRACFELFRTVYWTLRNELGLEDLYVDGAYLGVNALSAFTTPALVAQHCRKLFPAHFGVVGLRGACGGAAVSTIDGDGTAEPLFCDVQPASGKTGLSASAALLRWETCRSVTALRLAAATQRSRGVDVCLVGSSECGGHGDEGPVSLPHLAVGLQAKYLFLGPPCGSHHVAVYNELLRIEEDVVERHGSSRFVV